jgi:preflagellin peptidase FlaK
VFVETVAGVASLPDLLRLVAVPVFAWAAYRDLRTRRVANATWLPLYVLGVVLLLVEGWAALTAPAGSYERLRFLVQCVVSLGVVAPLGVLFWRLGGFGGADAKALVALAVLFPTDPVYDLSVGLVPLEPSPLGAFSLTVLTNTVLVGLAFPLALAVRNLLAGDRSRLLFVGRPVATGRVDEEYGRLLETPDGRTRRGLDLDALRMYLRWRGTDLDALLADPEGHRDPGSVDATFDPGDGAIEGDPAVADGGTTVPPREGGADAVADGAEADPLAAPVSPPGADYDDPWGAAAFLADVEGSAYGTTPDALREGLEVLVARERVWLTPGLPFIVPTFLGLVVGLVYGDLLFAAMGALGLA